MAHSCGMTFQQFPLEQVPPQAQSVIQSSNAEYGNNIPLIRYCWHYMSQKQNNPLIQFMQDTVTAEIVITLLT